MSARKEFPMSVVLSLLTGWLRLSSPEQVQELLLWMTGHQIATHQLPRAMEACRAYLREQYGWMSSVALDPEKAVHLNHRTSFIRGWEKERGATMRVPKLPPGRYEYVDPIVEFARNMGYPEEAGADA